MSCSHLDNHVPSVSSHTSLTHSDKENRQPPHPSRPPRCTVPWRRWLSKAGRAPGCSLSTAVPCANGATPTTTVRTRYCRSLQSLHHALRMLICILTFTFNWRSRSLSSSSLPSAYSPHTLSLSTSDRQAQDVRMELRREWRALRHRLAAALPAAPTAFEEP